MLNMYIFSLLINSNTEDTKFMLFYTQGDELVAVDSINNPKEFLICRKLVANKVKIKPEMISDTSTNLNDLI